MSKTLIIIAGLCRPRVQHCIENLDALKESFVDVPYETLLIHQSSNDYLELIKKVDHAIIFKEQTDEEIDSQFPNVQCRNAQKGWCDQTRIWRQRKMIETALNYAENNLDEFSHICLSRPCTTVKINGKEWINSNYNVIHANDKYIDDRFAVAPIGLFRSMWETDLEDFDKVDSDEEYLRYTADDYGVPIKVNNFLEYKLRPAE